LPTRDIIVIGASSGGVESLTELVSGLPADLAASLFIVTHVAANATSVLPQILSRSGPLEAAHANNEEPIQRGRIYVAPPDFHLLLANGRVRLVRGPKENNARPAIDPTFRTAAIAYGPRVIGVVLSGALDDGSAGLFAIKKRGGIAIVQDPSDALFPDMPRNAMEIVDVDYCVSKAEIAPLLARLAQEPVQEKAVPPVPQDMQKETEIEAMNMSTIQNEDKPGNPSVFGCPDCGGILWELQDGELLRFRCRVGHAYGAEGLLSAQAEALDSALWSAFRALEENASLARELAERAKKNERKISARAFEERAEAAEQQAAVIRQVLLSGKSNATMDKRKDLS
jgi:two-component system chemotaxis response regulator CheB